jgi:signal peptidase I
MGGARGFGHSVAMQSARALRLLVATLVVAGSALVGQAGIKSERMLAAIIERTPAPRLVAEGAQLKAAEKFAAALPRRAHALWGIGRSMEPLYATNTAVVVEEINYDDIKKGMTVVYVKSNGRRVAHSIVGETRGGFLVQGVNNDEEDSDLVTPDNFIGVITHAFASADTVFRAETEKRLAAKGKIRVSDRT